MTSNRMTLASLTAALLISASPAVAQMQQQQPPKGGPDAGGTAQVQGGPSGQKDQAEPRAGSDKGRAGNTAGKSSAQGSKESDRDGRAQSEPKGAPTKGARQEAQPKDKDSKAASDKSAEPREGKGTAQKSAEPKDSGGTARKSAEPAEKATKGTAEKGSSERVRTTEQQRANIGQTLVKERTVNRVNVDFSIHIGTRVPRSLRLVALPASIVAIVPAYRSYRYFVVGDRLCVVDPASYEIVEVIVISNETAVRTGPGHATLVLTDSERALIVDEIELRGGSTLGLGALSEGADVPRQVELYAFPMAVVEKVPKLRGYKFFTAENRIAIVDPQGTKVRLVIEARN
jgi:hypothetical protein